MSIDASSQRGVHGTRPEALQRVLALSRRALESADAPPAGARPVGERIFDTLAQPAQDSPGHTPARLPACEHLPAALAAARRGPGVVPALAEAFEALAPRLAWYRRPDSDREAGAFHEGHANAYLAGPAGLEKRRDAIAGVSLLAPGVRYPDHHHPPEEIYVVLSAGEWRQRDGPWHAPGPGGIVHNPPGVVHAMRAGDTPLLALWFLWP